MGNLKLTLNRHNLKLLKLPKLLGWYQKYYKDIEIQKGLQVKCVN